MIEPPLWPIEQLESERHNAEEHFREGRHTEPRELYQDLFDRYHLVVMEVMEQTVDLTGIQTQALSILTDPEKREVYRYLMGPPVSEDDLKVLMKAPSIAPSRLAEDPDLLAKVVDFLFDWHDRRRFPWVNGGWAPLDSERNSAILATTALLATRRAETLRRSQGKELQEERVEQKLVNGGLKKVKTRRISTLRHAPSPGEFCRESQLGTRKADFVIGLRDGRTLALECKVSNSSTNSVKRLNNDAAVKAEVWRSEFGSIQLVPAAVLSGVYRTHNLQDAQTRGLTIFWAHKLGDLVTWIKSAA